MSTLSEIVIECFRKHKLTERLLKYYQDHPNYWQLAKNRKVVEEHRKRHEQKARKGKR